MAKRRSAAASSGDDGDQTPPNFTVEHATQEPSLPTQIELQQLPQRLIVAYAVRCARRVQARFDPPDGYPNRVNDFKTIERALNIAASAAEGIIDPQEAVAVSYEAAAIESRLFTNSQWSKVAEVAYLTARTAARAAATEYNRNETASTAFDVAETAAEVVPQADLGQFIRQARRDYDHLKSEGFEAEATIDSSENGFLRDYWGRERQPEWYTKGVVELRKLRVIITEADRLNDLANKIQVVDKKIQSLTSEFLTWENILHFPSLCFLTLLIVVNVFAISEVYERQAFDRWLEQMIDQLRSNGQVTNILSATKPTRATLDLAIGEPPERYMQILTLIRTQLNVLSFTGATDRAGTVAGLRDSLQLALHPVSANVPAVFSPSTSIVNWHWYDWIDPRQRICYFSSDLLLSLVVLSSGIMGSVIAAIRERNALSIRNIGQGLSAGFVTFLVVRSGKSILLFEANPMLLVNPYNTAFFGLLAGMFTDMAFPLLAGYAREFVKRLEVKEISDGHPEKDAPKRSLSSLNQPHQHESPHSSPAKESQSWQIQN